MNNFSGFIKNNKNNLIIYLLGFLILGLSVNLIKASTIGSGAWDTVTINGYDLLRNIFGLNWVTMGIVSFSVSIFIMIIVISYRRKKRYLLMLIPIFGVALFIDFWNLLVFHDYHIVSMEYRILSYVVGGFLLPFGLALMVKSNFTAFVFDELMLMVVKITKAKQIIFVRLGIETIGLLIGLTLGYFAYYIYDGTFGAVSFGSLILSFTISPIMTVYFSLLKIKTGN